MSRKFLPGRAVHGGLLSHSRPGRMRAAIARQTSDPYLARVLVSMIEDFPGINRDLA